MRGSERDKERAPLEWVFLGMIFTLVKDQRIRYRSSLLTHYRDMYRELGSDEGFQSLLRLFAHTVQDLVREAKEQRANQALALVSTGNRIVVLSGLAAVVVGVGYLANGIARYSSMRMFPTYSNLPAHIPLGILGEPVVFALLTTAGCAGLYALLKQRSALALCGIYLAVASAILTLFLSFYNWAFDPVYYSDTAFGLKSVEEVDSFAANILSLKSWALALGTILLAIAARRSTKLRRWWPMLLIVGFVQSPLFERCAHSLFGSLIKFQTHLMMSQSQIIFGWSGKALFELQIFLFYVPSIVPGLTWALLGLLLMAKVLFHQSEHRLRTSR